MGLTNLSLEHFTQMLLFIFFEAPLVNCVTPVLDLWRVLENVLR